MARIHARKKGKSGSIHPHHETTPDWVQIETKEIEKLIVDLYKQGNSTSQIGITLRDQHGIPLVKMFTGMKITKILEKHGISLKLPEDLTNLMRKALNIHKHLQDNRKDLHNKRQLHLTEAKVRRLVKYYKNRKLLPAEWKYTREAAKLLVE
tara:strand:- start:66 stop:521 length:456 start_codon:yes stop_codon:yes gene_type:complete